MTNLELHPRHRVNSTGSRILIVIFSLVALGFTAVAWTMDISANARAGAWRRGCGGTTRAVRAPSLAGRARRKVGVCGAPLLHKK